MKNIIKNGGRVTFWGSYIYRRGNIGRILKVIMLWYIEGGMRYLGLCVTFCLKNFMHYFIFSSCNIATIFMRKAA